MTNLNGHALCFVHLLCHSQMLWTQCGHGCLDNDALIAGPSHFLPPFQFIGSQFGDYQDYATKVWGRGRSQL